MTKHNLNNDTFSFLKSSGIPFLTWVTIIVFGTLFYADSQSSKKDTIERFERNEQKEEDRFQQQERRFDDFAKFRDKQIEGQNQLLLEVKTMGSSLNAAIKVIEGVSDEQKEMRNMMRPQGVVR